MYGIVNIIIKVDATGQTTTQRKFLSWKFLAPFSSFDNCLYAYAQAYVTLRYKNIPDYRCFPGHLEATNLDLVM